jgi:predicted ester cyclase
MAAKTPAELTRAFIEALEAKDYPAMEKLGCKEMRFYAPDFDQERDGSFLDYLPKWTNGFPDYRIPIGELFGEGNKAAFTWAFSGTNTGSLPGPDGSEIPATGKKVTDALVVGIAEWQGERLATLTCRWDQLGLLQQLGLA